MNASVTNWPLAFGLDHVIWDGKTIGLREEADVRKDAQVHRDAGLEHVHLAGFHYEEPSSFNLPPTVKWLRNLLDDYGLTISSHHCMVCTFTDIDQDQTPVTDRLLETIKLLAPLDPNVLVIHPGRCWGYHPTVKHIIDRYESNEARFGREAMIETSANNLRVMARAAADHGIKLALENLGRWEALADMDTLPALVDAIDEPNVGYCLDTGHAHAFNQSQTWWLQTIGKRLFATHFHDNHARGNLLYPSEGFVENVRAADEHLPVGFGTIPWMEVIHNLVQIDYQGVVTFETGGWPVSDPVESLTQAVAWWRACTTLATGPKAAYFQQQRQPQATA